jgi:hypothetical protein
MELVQKINDILRNDELDTETSDETKCNQIERLADDFGWESIEEVLIKVLEDDTRRIVDWHTIAEVFWGAALDKRNINENKVIALLYYRIPNDAGSNESNLVWSIASKLKGANYLSEYDPLNDPDVIKEMQKFYKRNEI